LGGISGSSGSRIFRPRWLAGSDDSR
jgi:hypothetical protein